MEGRSLESFLVSFASRLVSLDEGNYGFRLLTLLVVWVAAVVAL